MTEKRCFFPLCSFVGFRLLRKSHLIVLSYIFFYIFFILTNLFFLASILRHAPFHQELMSRSYLRWFRLEKRKKKKSKIFFLNTTYLRLYSLIRCNVTGQLLCLSPICYGACLRTFCSFVRVHVNMLMYTLCMNINFHDPLFPILSCRETSWVTRVNLVNLLAVIDMAARKVRDGKSHKFHSRIKVYKRCISLLLQNKPPNSYLFRFVFRIILLFVLCKVSRWTKTAWKKINFSLLLILR